MARYVSAEKRFNCCRCHIMCTVREMKSVDADWMFCCPNCNWMILFSPNPGSSLLFRTGEASVLGAVDGSI